MSRPRPELGTWGKITRTEVAEGKHRARARFRDFTGKTKQVEAYGPSGAKAERQLLANLRSRVEAAGDTISGNTTVSSLGKIWTGNLGKSDEHTEQTIERYESIVEKIIGPALGEYLIMEATVSRVDGFLRALADKTPGRGKTRD